MEYIQWKHFRKPRNDIENRAIPLVLAWETLGLLTSSGLPEDVEAGLQVIDRRIRSLAQALKDR